MITPKNQMLCEDNVDLLRFLLGLERQVNVFLRVVSPFMLTIIYAKPGVQVKNGWHVSMRRSECLHGRFWFRVFDIKGTYEPELAKYKTSVSVDELTYIVKNLKLEK